MYPHGRAAKREAQGLDGLLSTNCAVAEETFSVSEEDQIHKENRKQDSRADAQLRGRGGRNRAHAKGPCATGVGSDID